MDPNANVGGPQPPPQPPLQPQVVPDAGQRFYGVKVEEGRSFLTINGKKCIIRDSQGQEITGADQVKHIARIFNYTLANVDIGDNEKWTMDSTGVRVVSRNEQPAPGQLLGRPIDWKTDRVWRNQAIQTAQDYYAVKFAKHFSRPPVVNLDDNQQQPQPQQQQQHVPPPHVVNQGVPLQQGQPGQQQQQQQQPMEGYDEFQRLEVPPLQHEEEYERDVVFEEVSDDGSDVDESDIADQELLPGRQEEEEQPQVLVGQEVDLPYEAGFNFSVEVVPEQQEARAEQVVEQPPIARPSSLMRALLSDNEDDAYYAEEPETGAERYVEHAVDNAEALGEPFDTEHQRLADVLGALKNEGVFDEEEAGDADLEGMPAKGERTPEQELTYQIIKNGNVIYNEISTLDTCIDRLGQLVEKFPGGRENKILLAVDGLRSATRNVLDQLRDTNGRPNFDAVTLCSLVETPIFKELVAATSQYLEIRQDLLTLLTPQDPSKTISNQVMFDIDKAHRLLPQIKLTLEEMVGESQKAVKEKVPAADEMLGSLYMALEAVKGYAEEMNIRAQVNELKAGLRELTNPNKNKQLEFESGRLQAKSRIVGQKAITGKACQEAIRIINAAHFKKIPVGLDWLKGLLSNEDFKSYLKKAGKKALIEDPETGLIATEVKLTSPPNAAA